MPKRITDADYKEWLAQDGRGITALEPYVHSRTKIEHSCAEGHQWSATPGSIKNGTGCPYCSVKAKPATEEYLEWLISDGRGITALEPYVNNKTKIAHSCAEGHEWSATPNSIKRGRGCPRCHVSNRFTPAKYEDWLKRDGRGITALEPYSGSATKILHQCAEGHEWSAPPSSIKRGYGCPNCAYKGKARLSPESYQEWLDKDGRGITALEPYAGAKTKILHQCADGHQWSAKPNVIKSGHGCPNCAYKGKASLTPEEYDEWLRQDGRDIVALEPYLNNAKKILHRCSEGHEWRAKPNGIKSGYGCPRCADTRLSPDDYDERLKRDGRGITALEPYVSAGTRLLHRCPEGHEWSAMPINIKRGTGCPQCAESVSDYDSIYCWKVAAAPDDVPSAMAGHHLVKFGVTSQRTKKGDRIRYCSTRNGMTPEVIAQCDTSAGDALKFEEFLLSLGVPVALPDHYDGRTEFRIINDSELATVKELMGVH